MRIRTREVGPPAGTLCLPLRVFDKSEGIILYTVRREQKIRTTIYMRRAQARGNMTMAAPVAACAQQVASRKRSQSSVDLAASTAAL